MTWGYPIDGCFAVCIGVESPWKSMATVLASVYCAFVTRA